MMKCVAEQILGNWLEIILTYMETYFLDNEVLMEAELNRFCIIPFKGSKEMQLIEFNGCWTLMMKFGIIGKTMTSNEETVFGNLWLCYLNLWKTSLWSANWNMGWKPLQ